MTELREWYAEHGICIACGRAAAVKGIKLCPECYAKAVRSMAYARKFVKSGWQSGSFIFGRKERS